MGVLGFSLQSYPGVETLCQVLRVYLNGAHVGSLNIAGSLEADVILRDNIAANLRIDELNLLQFTTSAPMIPAKLLGNSDERKLGFALRRMWLW